MTITLNGEERFVLSRSILPTEGLGDLRESLIVKDLRSRFGLDEDEREAVNLQEGAMGQVSLNPSALKELDEKEFTLTDDEARVIALGFLHDEADGNVRGDEAYSRIVELFIDTVEEVRDEDT